MTAPIESKKESMMIEKKTLTVPLERATFNIPKVPPRNATFSIDGSDFTLVYNFSNICKAERALGVNLMAALAGAELSANQFTGLLCAFLLANHSDITVDQVSAMIRPETMPSLMAAIGHLMSPAEKALEDAVCQ